MIGLGGQEFLYLFQLLAIPGTTAVILFFKLSRRRPLGR